MRITLSAYRNFHSLSFMKNVLLTFNLSTRIVFKFDAHVWLIRVWVDNSPETQRKENVIIMIEAVVAHTVAAN
jgi:hypothetical protein